MNSQADALRARMQAIAPGAAAAESVPPAAPHLAHTLAIGSGKGGVGKSTVALGIAWAAAERGVKTALIDADLGLANLDILCGIQPARTAADWLAGRAPLAECFTRLAPRLWLLPGASGVARMADLEHLQRERLLAGLTRVAAHVDLMVVDLGAGLGAGTLDIAAAADRLLVVSTPEPTALADAYGLVKACVRRGRTERITLAMNMARDRAVCEHAVRRLCGTCARFLRVDMEHVGTIGSDDAVHASVEARRPLLAHAPHATASRALRTLEGRVNGAESRVAPARGGGLFAMLARSLGLGAGGVPVRGRLPACAPREQLPPFGHARPPGRATSELPAPDAPRVVPGVPGTTAGGGAAFAPMRHRVAPAQ